MRDLIKSALVDAEIKKNMTFDKTMAYFASKGQRFNYLADTVRKINKIYSM